MGNEGVKGSDSCSKPAHAHLPVGSGNTFQGVAVSLPPPPADPALGTVRDGSGSPPARPCPPLLAPSPARRGSQSTRSPLPLPRQAPPGPGPALLGRGELGDAHLFCMNFPSLFSLLFSEFVQAKPSPDLAIEKNNELGPAFPPGSPPFGRKQPRNRCLDSGKGPNRAQISYLLPQPG